MQWNKTVNRLRAGFRASSSPCSYWRRTSQCPPWAAVCSLPDEMEESASSSHRPGSQTASSRTSFDPPWRQVPPPAAERRYHTDVWRYSTFCRTDVYSYQSSDGSRNWSSTGSRRPSSNTLNKLLQRQRHQPGVLLWLHHVPNNNITSEYVTARRRRQICNMLGIVKIKILISEIQC